VKIFRTKAIINASADMVWQTITDGSLYPQFDPNCVNINGKIAQGKYIVIRSKLSPNRAFKVKVSEIKPQERMVWESGLPFNLFRGVRTFTVIAKDDQTTEFHMEEVFSGHLFNLFAKQLPDMSDAFRLFSQGLKKFIESR
jgi:hypothetical protein